METALKFFRIGPGSLSVYKEDKPGFFKDLFEYSEDDTGKVIDMLQQGASAIRELEELRKELAVKDPDRKKIVELENKLKQIAELATVN